MVWTCLLLVSLQAAAFLRLKRRVLGAPQVSRGSTHHGEWTLITQVLQARCGLHVHTHILFYPMRLLRRNPRCREVKQPF